MEVLRKNSQTGSLDIAGLMETIQRNANYFRRIDQPESGNRFDVFLRRIGTMDIVVFHPVLLNLIDRFRHVSDAEASLITPIATALESYLVRRMVCGYQTRGYGNLSIELLKAIVAEPDDSKLIDTVNSVLKGTYGAANWWPDDNFFMQSWTGRRFYGMLRRERVVMLLQALEEKYISEIKYAEPVLHFDFSKFQIEHVMPHKWQEHWSLADGVSPESREAALHGIGNLTLLSGELNPALSNAPWNSTSSISKRSGLVQHSKLELNQRLSAYVRWDEIAIKERAKELFENAKVIWPPCPEIDATISTKGAPHA